MTCRRSKRHWSQRKKKGRRGGLMHKTHEKQIELVKAQNRNTVGSRSFFCPSFPANSCWNICCMQNENKTPRECTRPNLRLMQVLSAARTTASRTREDQVALSRFLCVGRCRRKSSRYAQQQFPTNHPSVTCYVATARTLEEPTAGTVP